MFVHRVSLNAVQLDMMLVSFYTALFRVAVGALISPDFYDCDYDCVEFGTRACVVVCH